LPHYGKANYRSPQDQETIAPATFKNMAVVISNCATSGALVVYNSAAKIARKQPPAKLACTC
jgi:hypothetical protein